MNPKRNLKEVHDTNYVYKFEKIAAANNIKINRLLNFCKLKETDIVTDFACGSGMLMPLIAPKVKKYYGVDFSEPFIKVAEKKKNHLRINNVEFFCSGISEFCANHINEFDAGFAMDFSEHVYDEEWLEILRAIRDSIKSNGTLYLHTPNANFFLEVMRNKNFILTQREEHIAVRTPEENVKLLKEAGFSVVKLSLIAHYNILKVLHPLSYLPILGKYFKARIFIEAIV